MTAAPTPDEHEARFWVLAEPMLTEVGVTPSTMMGLPCLRIDGKFFASFDRATGDLLVKLPAPRVDQLFEAGLLQVRPDGNRRLYQCRREGLRDAAAFVEEMWSERLARLKTAAEREEWPQRTRDARPTTTKEQR